MHDRNASAEPESGDDPSLIGQISIPTPFQRDGIGVILPLRDRKVVREFERIFSTGAHRQSRRLATRHGKLLANNTGFLN